jgi:hypothetical protein
VTVAVKDQSYKHLPPPRACDACGSPRVEFGGNDRIYGRHYGVWPYCYLCLNCNATVGCHPKTRHPLGRMAGCHTRKLRVAAHNAFDPIWQSRQRSRKSAYRLLAEKLGISKDECHMSLLSDEQLARVPAICAELKREGEEAEGGTDQ